MKASKDSISDASFKIASKIENGEDGQFPEFAQTPTSKEPIQSYVEDCEWPFGATDLPRIDSAAITAAQTEHRMTFREGLRAFPRAIFWSAVISMAIVGEGFDTGLINSLYAFETFQKSYGEPASNGTYQVSPQWQANLNNGAVAGSIIGLLVNGWLSERLGYRRTLMLALSMLAAFIFLTFFAFNIETLLAGQILCGLPWGICSTLTVSYAAEVMPMALRGYLTANVNMCWIIGQIIALGSLRGLLGSKSNWSYRIPFALQWAWVVIVGLGAVFAPESPWWLVRKGRVPEAKAALRRLASNSQHMDPDGVIALMQHTNEVEKRLNNGKALRNDLSYFECFRGTNLRRTEIVCLVFVTQNLCGLPLIGMAAYFYRNIGFRVDQSFDITLGMHGLALLACLLSLVLIKHFGRRRLYLCGLGMSFVILVTAATLGTVRETRATLWAQAAMVICFIFVFDSTVGPITYTLVGEIPSTRLRINTIVLARVSYNICAIITNVINLRALNPLGWNLRGKSNWIWAGTCLLCLVYCWFRLPETKGLTYYELDLLFEKKADARKFASIQRKLDETGYFDLYDRNSSVTAWQ